MTQPETLTAAIAPAELLGYVALHCLEGELVDAPQRDLGVNDTLFEQSAQTETIMPTGAMTYKIITVVTPGSSELDRIELSKEDD